MRANKTGSKSALFLIELIIAIAFFAVASAVCMQLFVKAHLLSSSGRDLNRATAAATSAASCFKSGGDPETVAALLGGVAEDDWLVHVYYDQDWRPVDGADSHRYVLSIVFYEEYGLRCAEVGVTRPGEPSPIYSMKTARSGT